MKIDDKTITHLEDLSFLTLSKEERARIAVDLEAILDGMATLSMLDTTGVSQTGNIPKKENVLRADEIKTSFLRADILKNAPNSNNEYIVAPKTVE